MRAQACSRDKQRDSVSSMFENTHGEHGNNIAVALICCKVSGQRPRRWKEAQKHAQKHAQSRSAESQCMYAS